jgi:NhaP-type Na+/H+ or K+/H+ antiporter
VLALVVIMAIFLVWALVAGRLARWSITAPLAMAVAGIVLTHGPSPAFEIRLDTSTAEHWVEVVLAILLFVDATEVPGGILGREPRLTLRLLGIALPLTFGLAVLAGYLVFPGTSFWLLAVLATIVIPIDLAPAAAIVRDRRVPARLRDLLNVESGLNDGVVAPVFLFCLAAAQASDRGTVPLHALLDALPGIVIAIVVGGALGYASAWIIGKAWARGWTQPSALRLGVAALPLMTYGLSIVLHGNGFVAAFVAGAFFGSVARKLPADALHLAEDTGTLFSLVVWFIFGLVVNQTMSDGIELRVFGYGLLALTVVRIVPVMISLVGTNVGRSDTLFLGWLGPRGLASIVFGLLAYIGLPAPDNDLVGDVMVATVLLSVVIHGLSFGPIAAWYGRRNQRLATAADDPDDSANDDDESGRPAS